MVELMRKFFISYNNVFYFKQHSFFVLEKDLKIRMCKLKTVQNQVQFDFILLAYLGLQVSKTNLFTQRN